MWATQRKTQISPTLRSSLNEQLRLPPSTVHFVLNGLILSEQGGPHPRIIELAAELRF